MDAVMTLHQLNSTTARQRLTVTSEDERSQPLICPDKFPWGCRSTDLYDIEPKVLGTGSFGCVRRCVDRFSRQTYAIKSIRRNENRNVNVNREIELLEELKHASIIKLVDVFEEEKYYHLVTDLCFGGELYDKIADRVSAGCSDLERFPACFSEHEAAHVLKEILLGVEYMHRQGVVHRDIKPENILFKSKEVDSPIMIIDFGLARKFDPYLHGFMSTLAGTLDYIAPEVLQQKYSASCDLWSIGVIAYILLHGSFPFRTPDNICTAIPEDIYIFPLFWKNASCAARNFIQKLLEVDATKRMSAEEALQHPWLLANANRK
jgi:calcium-dependent protein kinase